MKGGSARFAAWLAVAAAALWGVGGEGAERMRVTGNRVNMRSLPGFENSEVLAQADYGEIVTAVEKGDEWVGVEPPGSVSYWVNKLYVSQPENTVGANRLNVRAGPSLNYNVVATLERGTAVDVKEELGEWLRIGAPTGTLVWIYRDFLETAEEPAAADAGTAAVAAASPVAAAPVAAAEPEKVDLRAAPVEVAADVGLAVEPGVGATTNAAAVAQPAKRRKTTPRTESAAALEPTRVAVPEVSVAEGTAAKKGRRTGAKKEESEGTRAVAAQRDLPTPIVAPSRPEGKGGDGLPASFKLIPLDGQGRSATYEGVLRAAPLFNDAPARYRVLRWQDNRWQLLCHVYGEASKFRALQDKSVRVSGKEYWIQNTAAPVLIPDRIQEIKLTEDVR